MASPRICGRTDSRWACGWRRFWRYTGGDSIIDPIHQIDLAMWLCDKQYPKSVYSVGGKFHQDGVYPTPDTQVAVYEFDDMTMTLEVTLWTPYMIKADQVLRNSDIFPAWQHYATRVELFGTEGLMMVGRHGAGWQVFTRPHQRKPQVVAQEHGRWSDREHKEDFCNAIRNNRRPNSDIELVHRSCLIPQFANISYRLGGRKLTVDPATESFTDCPEANAMLKREYRQPWVVPNEV